MLMPMAGVPMMNTFKVLCWIPTLPKYNPILPAKGEGAGPGMPRPLNRPNVRVPYLHITTYKKSKILKTKEKSYCQLSFHQS